MQPQRPKRGIPKAERKYKYGSQRKKLEAQRQRRDTAREAAGKKPLIRPLKIDLKKSRKGYAAFQIGPRQIVRVPLKTMFGNLRGVHLLSDGEILIVRGGSIITLLGCQVKKGIGTDVIPGRGAPFFFAREDLAHMLIPERMRRLGLGKKFASRAERSVRSQNPVKRTGDRPSLGSPERKIEFYTKHSFTPAPFEKIFKSLGYERQGQSEKFEKQGKFVPTDDLNRYCKFEAIDPRTGKAKMYVFMPDGRLVKRPGRLVPTMREEAPK
jgi:GNAT superfamily N-acetyltransferase